MSEQCGHRGPRTRGQCSKVWWNEHLEHHCVITGERWTDADEEAAREAKKVTREGGEDPVIWDLVVADMRGRDKLGAQRYGKRLRPTTDIDPLQYAYEEALDLACYLRMEIYRRGGK